MPLDYTLTTGAALVAPRDVASPAAYRALAPGVAAWPVLRQVADAAGTRGAPLTPTVIGVPADEDYISMTAILQDDDWARNGRKVERASACNGGFSRRYTFGG